LLSDGDEQVGSQRIVPTALAGDDLLRLRQQLVDGERLAGRCSIAEQELVPGR
jgi:hypothetical protein